MDKEFTGKIITIVGNLCDLQIQNIAKFQQTYSHQVDDEWEIGMAVRPTAHGPSGSHKRLRFFNIWQLVFQVCHICRCTSLLAILLTWSFHFAVWMKYFLDKNQIKILYLIAYSILSYLLAFLLHFPNDQTKNKVILEKQRWGCKCVPQISLSQQTTLSLKSSRKSKVICLVIWQDTTVSCLAFTYYLLTVLCSHWSSRDVL